MGALDAYPPTRTGRVSVPLDHFRYSTSASYFHLRYAAYEAFATHPTSPVLFYCGNEGALELFYNATGALFEHAKSLGANVFFIEHRYYGASLPFGNASFANENMQWLSIEQALADYSLVISLLPSLLGCVGTGPRSAAKRCDVILFGGSYGGMLAAWHRLKYPFLSIGAIASGAPIDFYPAENSSDAHGSEEVQRLFFEAVINTFERYGSSKGTGGCGMALKRAFDVAETATPTELEAAGVVPCNPWQPDYVERFAFYAKGAVADIALVDYPYPANFIAPMPANPVRVACAELEREKGPQTRIRTLNLLVRAVLGLVNASADVLCFDLEAELVGTSRRSHTLRPASMVQAAAWSRALRRHAGNGQSLPSFTSSDLGITAWNYQACTELILEPITSDGFGFYPPAPDQISQTEAICRRRFGVQPRPGWMRLAFGTGADLKMASNIAFMENDKDPWHVGTRTVAPVGGIGGSVTRTVAKGGAHHQDLRFSSPLDAPDVVKARAFEQMLMRRWLRAPTDSEVEG